MAANPSYRNFTPEVYSDYVKMFFKRKLVAATHFTDFSDNVSGGGDVVYIPGIAELAAPSDVTTTTGALTDRYVADTRTSVTLNTWKAYSLRFTDFKMAIIAKKYEIQKRYAEAIAYNLAKTFDTALLDAAVAGLVVKTSSTTTTISSTVCRDAMKLIDSYSVPREGCTWIFSPAAYWELMRSTPIYDASVFGAGNAPMATGKHGSLFGIPIIVTQQAPLYTSGSEKRYSLLVHNRVMAYAFANIDGTASGVRLQLVKGDGLYSRLVGDIAYGMSILDTTGGVRILGATG